MNPFRPSPTDHPSRPRRRLRRALGALAVGFVAVVAVPTDANAIVTHRATSSNLSEAGGSLSVTKPAGTVQDDILIATSVQNDGGSITPPAGWTVLQSDQSDAASWYKVAGGSEPGSYSFSKSAGDTFAVIISAFAGGDTAAPIAGSAKTAGTASSAALPNTTAARNGSMRWSSAGLSPSNNVTATYSGGMTKVGERPGNDAALSAAVEATNAGTTASRTVTFSASDPYWAYTAVVNAALPRIDSISPTAGPLAGGQSVTITGKYFTSATGVTFGGTAGTSVNVVNDTTITVTTPARAAGTVDVRVTTPPGTSLDAGTADNYQYVDPPTVSGLSPTSGPTAGGTSVTITGTYFTGASQVQFGGTNASSYTVVNATTITATAPAGAAGTVDVRVTTPGGISANTAADNYTYIPPPSVTALSPTTGPESGGTTVTITGTNFSGLSGASAVQFGGTNAASYTVDSATQITATAPAGTGVADVRVTTPGGTSANTAADNYTYVPLPTVTAVSPNVGPTGGGTSVTITGTNFTGASQVQFGATNASSYTVVNATTITATAPAGSAGTVDVRVTTVGGTSANTASDNYTYFALPTVTALSPDGGPLASGTSVTITGANLTGATQVQFGATNAVSFTVVNATTITATAPAGSAGTVDVRVTTPGGTSANTAADNYTYYALPTVTGLSPGAGPESGGTSVTITGTNFTGLSGASAVQFGGVDATSYTVVNATTITATAPAGTGTANVRVTTPGGTSTNTAADDFTYVPLPTVTSLSPTAGPTSSGTSVTITGTNFTGASQVQFGGSNAVGFTVVNATTITATAPAGAAGTVDVRVTTTGGTSANTAADNYTYVAAPTVSSISPTSGPASGATSVTITGTNFTGASQVQFGGTNAASFTVVNATTITATSPAGTGVVDVRVTTVGGTSANTAADDFTFISAPTVTSVAPSTGATAGGTAVTITGTNFTGATQVRFGGVNATGYTVVNATTITATAPAGSGTVDVRVTTGGGQSANTAADNYTYADPPVVTSVSPTSGPTAGGTPVTITGSFFTGATSVTFGGTSASFTVVNATTITATSPARAAGTIDVRVTTSDGTSADTAADDFTYVGAPTVTGLSPTQGPDSGGTTVTITGTNLTGATSVMFGGTAALGYTVVNATTITATAPTHAAGTVDVRVTTVGGTSANTAADNYEFLAACGLGTLDLVTDDVTFTPFTLDGTDHTRMTSTTFSVSDMTGSGSGWKLAIGTEQFSAGPGKQLSTNAARIAGATATPLGGSCSAPTSTISSYPITLPISPSKTTIYNADVNTGRGPVDVELDVELDVPAHTMFGTYTSQWDVDLTAAP